MKSTHVLFIVVPATLLSLVLAGCTKMKAPVFDLTRIDAHGAVVTDADYAKSPWMCVRDNKTGLMWEVKTAGKDLHAGTNTYTWYEPDDERNGGHAGTPKGGSCTGSDCDTHAYVAAVNAEKLCGYSDWHLPTRGELGTIVDYSVPYPGPTVVSTYLPNMQGAPYWTGSPYLQYTGVWAWRFDYGYDYVAQKQEKLAVMLVRGDRTGDAKQ